MSIELVDKCISKAYRLNQTSVYISAGFIFILIIVGIVFGVLAINVKVDWAYFELFVLPVLGYMLKCFVTVTKNTPEILSRARATLEVANNQIQIAQIIREEKESEKQRVRIGG